MVGEGGTVADNWASSKESGKSKPKPGLSVVGEGGTDSGGLACVRLPTAAAGWSDSADDPQSSPARCSLRSDDDWGFKLLASSSAAAQPTSTPAPLVAAHKLQFMFDGKTNNMIIATIINIIITVIFIIVIRSCSFHRTIGTHRNP